MSSKTVALALAICALGSSRVAAVPRAAMAFQAAPVPNLAAYWPLDANANDLSGNGNNGTLNSGAVIDAADHATVPAGNAGSANFPTLGGGNRIDVPDSPSLSITGSITISAWIKTNLPVSPNVLPNVDLQEIVGKFGTGGGYFFRINSGGGTSFCIVDGSGTASGPSGTNKIIPTGTWTHVAATYDQANAGAIRMYVGGLQSSDIGSSPSPPPDGAGGLIIGRNGQNEFNGHIDEVRIYSRALNTAEITTLVNGVQPAPSALGATPGPGKIDLSWAAPASGPTPIAYNIYRAVNGGASTYYATSAGTTYTDNGVSNPSSYSYMVTAVAALESAQVGPATAVPGSTAPPPPHTASSGDNNNLAHRCGCSSLSTPAGPLGLALALAGLAFLLRRRG